MMRDEPFVVCAKVSKGHRLRLPQEVMDALMLQDGDYLVFRQKKGGPVLMRRLE